MMSVGALMRSGLLQLPVRGLSSVLSRKSSTPSLAWSAPPSVGLSSVCCCRPNIWTGSNIRTGSNICTGSNIWTVSNVRAASSVASSNDVAGSGLAGWYSSLADSAPVHMCEHFLVGAQQVSGLPWWLNIVVATLSVRTLITLPLAAYQLVIISKVEALQAEIAELAKRLRYEVTIRARDRGWTDKQCRYQFKKNLRRLVSQLYVRDNCHPFKASLLIWVQLPLWISLSLALRNLSVDESAVQGGLTTGGALWFPDLTGPDSTWILPVCLGLINLLVVEVTALQRVSPTRVQKLVLNTIRGFSVLMIPIAATVPSSMALYWFISSLVGFGHNLLLRSPTILKILRVRSCGSESPYKDLLSSFISKYRK